VKDTATITGGNNPSGSVSFTLYSDPSCTQPVSGLSGSGTIGNGSASYSTSWTPSAAGVYSWIASYPGDSNNAGFTTGYDDADEQLVISQASPSITTSASPTGGSAGQQLTATDTATITGGNNPSGSVSFTLYSDANCTQAVPSVSGSGTISNGSANYSTSWTPSATGTYSWIASYAGDANNAGFTTECSDANEQVVISQGRPSIATSASPTGGSVGQQLTVTDTATITGGNNPSGSVSFTLYSDANCTQAVSGVGGSGTISNGAANYSASWLPSATGTYSWIASYPGDANNAGFTTGCGAANEQIVIGQAGTGLTQASPTSGSAGQQLRVTDTATISGGNNPSGSVTFTLYRDPGCTQAVPSVSGRGTISNGSASYSTSWTPSTAGTYSWIASYPGDANNAGFRTGCGEANEQIVIGKASPSISTQASPTSGSLGQGVAVTDTATITGGSNPRGSVSFTLYSTSARSPYLASAATARSAAALRGIRRPGRPVPPACTPGLPGTRATPTTPASRRGAAKPTSRSSSARRGRPSPRWPARQVALLANSSR
jgi:hypothetical protein